MGGAGNATESITLRASDGRSDIRIQICRDNRSKQWTWRRYVCTFFLFFPPRSSLFHPALQISVDVGEVRVKRRGNTLSIIDFSFPLFCCLHLFN